MVYTLRAEHIARGRLPVTWQSYFMSELRKNGIDDCYRSIYVFNDGEEVHIMAIADAGQYLDRLIRASTKADRHTARSYPLTLFDSHVFDATGIPDEKLAPYVGPDFEKLRDV